MNLLAAGEKIEEAIVSHRKDIDEPLIKVRAVWKRRDTEGKIMQQRQFAAGLYRSRPPQILEDRYRTAVQLEENSETATGIKYLITRLGSE